MATLLRRVLDEVGRFRRDKSGNMILIFALSTIPLFGLVGAGVDYTTASRIRAELLAAADAATLGSVGKASAGYQAALAMGSDGVVGAGQQEALDLFNAQVKNRIGFTVNNVTATVTRANWQVTSNVQFTAAVPTTIMNVLGFSTMTVSGSSTAVNGMPAYIDFYLLLDNSPSMGLGATPTDINTLIANTPDQCAFACHTTNTTGHNNYYAIAKQKGVTMRINVLASATASLMDTATATASIPNQFRMAIYTFGSWNGTSTLSDLAKAVANNYAPNQVQALTPSLSTAKAAAQQIDLMTIHDQGEFNDMATNFDALLTAINTKIPNPGTGQGGATPQKVLFFVSDGVADEPNIACTKTLVLPNRCQEPLTPSLCQTIKDRGIRIAVLYTTYLPVTNNNWYMTYINPWNSQISQNMQACASPGLYFEVSPTQGISDAMNALFVKAVQTARLTQ